MTLPVLIADCGATSGKWALVDPASGSVAHFTTGPINASVQSEESVAEALQAALDACPASPGRVRLYAAGVIGAARERLTASVAAAFGLAADNVVVASDLVGAAEGLLGPDRGIACILGTGSNSCLWDGHLIVSNVSSMGYILGDEGSGAAIGAALLRAAVRGLMPPALAERWAKDYPGLSYPAIVDEVYRRQSGSAFIASFTPFAARNIDTPFISQLVGRCFDPFFSEVIALYPEADALPLAFTGGVAAAFEPQLRQAAGRHGYTIGRISAAPLDLLVDRVLH